MRRPNAAELLGAAVVAVVLLPVLISPGSRVIGTRYVDGFGTQWWFWYVGEVVAGRESLAHTDLLFFPAGKDVFTHTGANLLDALLALPLRTVFGPNAGYNVWVGLVAGTNYAAGCLLGRRCTGLAGWPSGLLLAVNPYVLQELAGGRPTQAWLALPALGIAGVWTVETPAGALLTGLVIAATGYLYWYAGLVVGVLALALGVLRIALRPGRPRSGLWLAVAAAVAILLVLPAVTAMRDAISGGSVPGLLRVDGTGALAPLALQTTEGDAAGMQVLAPLRGIVGSLLDEGGLRFIPAEPSLAFAGVGGSLVSLYLGVRERRWALVAAALTAATLSLAIACGPVVVYGDHFVVNRPWVFAASRLDLLRRWWWPGRAIIGVYLAMGMMLPLVVQRRWLAGAFALSVGVEVWRTGHLPVQTWDAREPAPLACLAAAPAGAVIDLPFLSDQRNLWFQTLHHHPILGGMLVKKPAFGSASVLALRAANPFLDQLLDYGDLNLGRVPISDEEGRKQLIDLGFRYVLVDGSRMEGAAAGRIPGGRFSSSLWPRLARLLGPVLGKPIADADGVALYTLDGSAVACPPSEGPMR